MRAAPKKVRAKQAANKRGQEVERPQVPRNEKRDHRVEHSGEEVTSAGHLNTRTTKASIRKAREAKRFTKEWFAKQRVTRSQRSITVMEKPRLVLERMKRGAENMLDDPIVKAWVRTMLSAAGILPKELINKRMRGLPIEKLNAIFNDMLSLAKQNKFVAEAIREYMYHVAKLECYAKVGDEANALRDRLSTKFFRWKAVDPNVIKMLLLIAGIEPNPGPVFQMQFVFRGNLDYHPELDMQIVRDSLRRNLAPSQDFKDAVYDTRCWEFFQLTHVHGRTEILTVDDIYPYYPALQKVWTMLNAMAGHYTRLHRYLDWAVKPIESGLQGEALRRVLVLALLIAGVEPNPGPPKQDSKQHSRRQRNQARRNKKDAAISQSAQQDASQLRGEKDALAQKVSELKAEVQDAYAANSEFAQEVSEKDALLEEAHRLGFTTKEDPVVDRWVFKGYFNGDESTYQETDPVNYVCRLRSGEYKVTLPNCLITSFKLDPIFESVAVTSSVTSDKQARMRNVRAAFRTNQKCVEKINGSPHELFTILDVAAYVFVGIMNGSGRTRWLNEHSEIIPTYYTCPEPLDADKKLKGVNFSRDLSTIQAQEVRRVRAAPYRFRNIVACIPAYWDFSTLKAGMCRRLFPDLPEPTNEALADIAQRAVDLCNYIKARSDPTSFSHFDLLEESLKGRPASEAAQMRQGFGDYMADPSGVLDQYLTQQYKSFNKRENMQEGALKPPRFIMSLPPYWRGVQVAAMGKILRLIEQGTTECNVKHLTAAGITQKLVDKFKEVPLCVESDFTSFESCLCPRLKNILENVIYYQLADSDAERNFVTRALRRDTVSVKGKGFTIPKFHHIRMSGDLWTSIGNLVSNIVIMSYVCNISIDEAVRTGLFEGDDGVLPAPDLSAETIKRRACDAGVLLKFARGPWYSLSFCGNQFEFYHGELFRHRDPLRVLAALTTIFNCDPTSTKNDRMLQRSKCLSVLSGPWVPGSSAGAAAIEFITRDAKVRDDYMIAHGLTKEYSPYASERCVPAWLASCRTQWRAAYEIWSVDRKAGGILSPFDIYRMISQLRDTGVSDIDPLDHGDCSMSWVARDGLKVPKVKHETTWFFGLLHKDWINRRALPSYWTVFWYLLATVCVVLFSVWFVRLLLARVALPSFSVPSFNFTWASESVDSWLKDLPPLNAQAITHWVYHQLWSLCKLWAWLVGEAFSYFRIVFSAIWRASPRTAKIGLCFWYLYCALFKWPSYAWKLARLPVVFIKNLARFLLKWLLRLPDKVVAAAPQP